MKLPYFFPHEFIGWIFETLKFTIQQFETIINSQSTLVDLNLCLSEWGWPWHIPDGSEKRHIGAVIHHSRAQQIAL